MSVSSPGQNSCCEFPVQETPDIESSTRDYSSRFAGPVGEWFVAVQSDAVVEALQGQGVHKVLDVGGGHCQNVSPVLGLECELEILGSDPSCSGLATPWLEAGELRFTVGDLLKLPYPDNAFDAVISIRNLPHLRDWEAHVKELCRVSSRLVIIDYPSTRSINLLASNLFFLKKAIEKNTRAYRLFPPGLVDKIFAQHGFIPDFRYPQFLLPMALYRALNSVALAKALESIARFVGLTRYFGSPIVMSYRINPPLIDTPPKSQECLD